MELKKIILLLNVELLLHMIEGENGIIYSCNFLSVFLGYTWVKVFSHDVLGGMFPSLYIDEEEVKNFNNDDPDAYRYSILDQIENYRKDGLFHIRICYPFYEEEFPCNEWTQSSNFFTKNDVVDYQPIRITYNESSRGVEFKGLRKILYSLSLIVNSNSFDYSFGLGFGVRYYTIHTILYIY